MAWTDKIFSYCERASDPTLFAEPLNAVSNLAFIFAATLALLKYHDRPSSDRHSANALLIATVFSIGVGSFLFHVFADRWSVLADVIPITLFIYVYLFIALTWFVAMRPWQAAALLVAFFVTIAALSAPKCSDGLVMITFADPSAKSCLNGSMGYLPPLAAMFVIGSHLKKKEHPAAGLILLAGAIFAVSLTCRTLDNLGCDLTLIGGKTIGIHFLWHFFNAATLYCLLIASITNAPLTGTARSKT